MASTPTPPPHFSFVATRPCNNNQRNNRHNQSKHIRNEQHYNRNHWSSTRYYYSNPTPTSNFDVGAPSIPVAVATSAPIAFSHSLSSFLGDWGTRLAPEFSGRQSTRNLGKVNSGCPKAIPNKQVHSKVAEEALHCLTNARDITAIDTMLLNYNCRLHGVDDYVYLLKEYANIGAFMLAIRTYDFAMNRARASRDKGKLTSNMIRTLGMLRKIDLAWNLFHTSRNAGYGNTVYTFSAMISVLGKNRRFLDAVDLFNYMKQLSLKPNKVTYNAIIDGGAKAEVDYDEVVSFFHEMVASNEIPDQYTYNSLLKTCVSRGRWELCKQLMNQMEEKGIKHDAYTYNTYLDALCKAGRVDFAWQIMNEEMMHKRIWPNVVTYSTLMDGYSKANRLEDALNVYDAMKLLSIRLDRVSYNTLIGVYAKLGLFKEAESACQEMESYRIKNDVITYNALMSGYGKHNMFVEVKGIFDEMKARCIYPNELTYSTMINVYTKGGMYAEAMDVYREFKQQGMEVDVVFYSTLIDALCKNGLIESSVRLLNAMKKKEIWPNVVTYNSIVDAFGVGQVFALECGFDISFQAKKYQIEPSSSSLIGGNSRNHMTYDDDEDDDEIIKMFGQLAAKKVSHRKIGKRSRQDNLFIVLLFQDMHKMGIKPNVVTFSAILNACSHCDSFLHASKLLHELRPFDEKVYGIAHALLTGHREAIWPEAITLFGEITKMDSSTASAFYNALTDMLWHFGQKLGAKIVVLDGKDRYVWKCDWFDSCLDLHLMSCGAACAMVHAWLLHMQANVYQGSNPPTILSILTGWGKHSKIIGSSTLKKAIDALLKSMGARFHMANEGRFILKGPDVVDWLKQPKTFKVLDLQDCIVKS